MTLISCVFITELRFKNRFVKIIFFRLQLIDFCGIYSAIKPNIYLPKIKAM